MTLVTLMMTHFAYFAEKYTVRQEVKGGFSALLVRNGLMMTVQVLMMTLNLFVITVDKRSFNMA